ncbi:MAG: DUF4290 domain-containing protein [Bacteroidales bacterium]|nr:DUF4290 domain-containing protein [Bacteroidales bacterium]
MKKSYVTWNRGQVSDDVIIGDLKLLSGGKLKVPENLKILEVKDIIVQQANKKKPQQAKSHSKQQNKQHNKKKGHNRH